MITKLSEIMECDPVTEKQKIVIFDFSNIAYRSVFSAIFADPFDNVHFNLFKHMLLNSFLTTISIIKPQKVIVAIDERKTWRHDLYSNYKANRKEMRDKSVLDYDKWFPILNDFLEQLSTNFTNIYFIKVDNCEADDIIAVLSKETFKGDDVTIISTDGDMRQLLINENIKQYNPFDKAYINVLNPSQDLSVKILTGDRGDNIPPIRKGVGEVTAKKILDSGLDDYLNIPEHIEIKANWERNNKLINFDFIPENIRQKIINTFNEYPIKEIDGKKVVRFFVDNRLIKIMDKWQEFSPYIKALI